MVARLFVMMPYHTPPGAPHCELETNARPNTRTSPLQIGGEKALRFSREMHRPLGLTTIRSSEYPVFSCGGGEGGGRRPTSTRGRSASSVSSPSVASPLAKCQALRSEARRLWTNLAKLHAQARARGGC